MLSGPRRTQAGSHLPENRPDTRCGESRKRPTTGPCGELATHFMGLLVLCSTGILPVRIGLLSVVSGPLSVVSQGGRRVLVLPGRILLFGSFGVVAVDADLVWLELILVGGVFGFLFHAADAWGNEYIPCNPPKIRFNLRHLR